MKPFRLPPRTQRRVNARSRVKDAAAARAVSAIEAIMVAASDHVIDNWVHTGRYQEPDLGGLLRVTEGFYKRAIVSAIKEAKHEKSDIEPAPRSHAQLAKGPEGIPKHLRGLYDLLRGGVRWRTIFKRAERVSGKMRKQYQSKLRRQFEQVVPMLTDGVISPAEAKDTMRKAWDTSKSRVETIFRTETTNYFEKANVSFFDGDPDIIGFLFDSVRDVARTDICRSRHGLVYRPGSKELHDDIPPCHWNCRSHLIALADTPANRKMLEDPQRDPSRRKVVPLPPGWRK